MHESGGGIVQAKGLTVRDENGKLRRASVSSSAPGRAQRCSAMNPQVKKLPDDVKEQVKLLQSGSQIDVQDSYLLC